MGRSSSPMPPNTSHIIIETGFLGYKLDTFFFAKNRQIILVDTPFCWYRSYLCNYVYFGELKKKFRAVQKHQSADGAGHQILRNFRRDHRFNMEQGQIHEPA